MDFDVEFNKLVKHPLFFDLLEVLDDGDLVPEGSPVGIVRQILGEKTIDNLSENQIVRFKEHVMPLMRGRCKECGLVLDLDQIISEYEQGASDSNELMCSDCRQEVK
jgi:hypothetical protein